MKKTKKLLALLLVAVLLVAAVVTIVACGPGKGPSGDGKIELVLWAPSAAQTFYKTWAAKWAENYKDADGNQYKVTIGIYAESEVADPLMTSPTDGADLFLMADDQVAKLAKAGILSDLGTGAWAQDVKDRNTPNSVASATYKDVDGEHLLAYPMQADNTYYLFYNDKYLTETEITSWTAIFNKIKTLNEGKIGGERKKMQFDFDDAWYGASWFYSYGGVATETIDEKVSTFHTEAVGKKALTAAHMFSKTGGEDIVYEAPKDAIGGLVNESLIAAVAGSWIYGGDEGVEQNEHIKLAVLPAIDFVPGEASVPMKAFLSSKLIGVNAMGQYPDASHDLANYLTSEEVQRAKAIDLYAGPSNKNAADDPAIAELPTVKVAADQAKCAAPQINLPVGFWDAVKACVTPVRADKTTTDYFNADGTPKEGLNTLLTTLENSMFGLTI